MVWWGNAGHGIFYFIFFIITFTFGVVWRGTVRLVAVEYGEVFYFIHNHIRCGVVRSGAVGQGLVRYRMVFFNMWRREK